MASGHVNRANRPNTWLHRPMLQREKSSCQLGAVHTGHFRVLMISVVLAGTQIQMPSTKGYSDRAGLVTAKDNGAFTPALGDGIKKQVKAVWHGRWTMHHQLCSLI
jgi:hypothetical protein